MRDGGSSSTAVAFVSIERDYSVHLFLISSSVAGLHIFVSLRRKEEVESPEFLNAIVCSLYLFSWLLLTFAFSDAAASPPPSTIKRRVFLLQQIETEVYKVG